MEHLTPEQVITRAGEAKTDKQIFDTELEDCYRFIIPGRNSYFDKAAGERDDEFLFDDTAPNALKEFAGFLQSSLVRPMTKWATLVAGTDVPEEDRDEINARLAPVNDVLMKAIWHSNFDSQILEMFFDLGIGTGSLLITDGGSVDNPIKFQSVPLNEIYPELGAFGELDTNFRFFSVIGRNIMQRWPDGKLNQELADKIANKPSAKIDIIEAVIFHPATKMKKAKYVYQIIAVAEKHEIFTIDMKESAWVMPRWDTRAGETLGRGPGWNMLPTIKCLNELAMMTMMNVEKQVNNIWVTNDQAILDPENITFEPNSVISANWDGNNLPIQALGGNADFNVGQMQMSDMKQAIKEAFFIGALGSITDPTKSATEIAVRNQMRLQQLGAQTGRLQTEFVNKTIRRVYSLLADRNMVPKDLILDGKQVSIQIEGTLAKAQLLEDGQNTLNFFSVLGQLSPELVGVVATPDTIVWLAQTMGVPPERMPTSTELEKRLKLAAEAQQQQQPAPAPVIPQA